MPDAILSEVRDTKLVFMGEDHHEPSNIALQCAILEQMKSDELKHAVTAKDAGGADLPPPVRHAMTLMSKVMTFTTYRI